MPCLFPWQLLPSLPPVITPLVAFFSFFFQYNLLSDPWRKITPWDSGPFIEAFVVVLWTQSNSSLQKHRLSPSIPSRILLSCSPGQFSHSSSHTLASVPQTLVKTALACLPNVLTTYSFYASLFYLCTELVALFSILYITREKHPHFDVTQTQLAF